MQEYTGWQSRDTVQRTADMRVHHLKPVLNIRKGKERKGDHRTLKLHHLLLSYQLRIASCSPHLQCKCRQHSTQGGLDILSRGQAGAKHCLPPTTKPGGPHSHIYTHTPGRPHLDGISSKKHLGTRPRDHFVNDILTFIIKSYRVRV